MEYLSHVVLSTVSMRNYKNIKKNLCSKLESWGIKPIILAKAIGIFIVLVIIMALMIEYPVILIIFTGLLVSVVVIMLIYSLIV